MSRRVINHNLKILIILLVFLFILPGCQDQTKSKTGNVKTDEIRTNGQQEIFKDINVDEANNLIKENREKKDFFILDVRTESEYQSGHIERAEMIDFYAKDFKEKLDNLDKEKKYLVYCRSANRSGQTVDIMKELGFKEVYNMLGGIIEWEKKGYPLVK